MRDGVAFAAGTARKHYFTENVVILGTFMSHHGTYTAGSYDYYF